ncbi:MAG: endopeptidase La, partial [Firmicutes bacterium]|nr:endopeptidase La [Bacillota bacterium]
MARKTTRRQIPLLPLRGILVFPYMVVHLDVGRDKSIAAIEEAMAQGNQILLATQKDPRIDEPEPEEIYRIGTVAEIKQLLKIPGGTIRVLVEGLARTRITTYLDNERFYLVEAEEYDEEEEKGSVEVEALTRRITFQFEQYVKLSKKIPAETVVSIVTVDDPGRLADLIAAHLNIKQDDKQRLLEAVRLTERLKILYQILSRELEILEIEHKIGSRVRRQMEKTQKEYYLREQLKAIQKELGERGEEENEAQEFKERIAKTQLPPEVREKAEREADRLSKMPPMAAEAVVVRTYLEWL